MLEFIENDKHIQIALKNKLSISSVGEIINLTVDNTNYNLRGLSPQFKSASISLENENVFNGVFSFTDGLTISGKNSIELQELYLGWEAVQLERTHVTFKVPVSRIDSTGGVAPYNPYFFAVVNKIARISKSFDLIGFGEFLDDREMKFVHQYCSFHPALRKHITMKDEFGSSERVSISCKAFELLVFNALAHVEGYRDKLRFKSLYESRSKQVEMHVDLDDEFSSSKFLMEYEHVLDSPSIWNESFDFYNYESSGGLLDFLNLPF
ncbi:MULTISPECIES: hypothetical protein [Acinetobacter]|uniref:hypothetical protein n=1 Tax=Acinetobacter TaxID=469 RepID=UPI00028BEDEF|nr:MULTISPECIES: hypothetical protein [Acinetobacter]MDP7851010.1 hypothetical protein [Acinetobacter baumannii]BBL22166.1 hypothetical protein ACRAD_28370 [Acinetobacter radioresistens DSM 6976 = NBRC 102413 = CIP 103788]